VGLVVRDVSVALACVDTLCHGQDLVLDPMVHQRGW
jgi:hypothetical protein